MKKCTLLKAGFVLSLMVLSLVLICGTSNAYTVITSSGSGFDGAGDPYSYDFEIITDNEITYTAMLANTSGAQSFDLAEPLIDALGFNMNATVGTNLADAGTDFIIQNINPTDWTIDVSANNISFDYTGTEDPGPPDNRLGIGESLTWEFVFDADFISNLGDDVHTIWTGTAQSDGKGFGGGQDNGQMAVSFQQLGLNGNGSDLVASMYTGFTPDGGEIPPAPIDGVVPEPTTVLLLGLGLAGMACEGIRRKRRRKNK